MDEKYTVELVSPVPPDKFDDTVEKVAAVIKKDTAAVNKLLGRGPGKLTKGTSKQKADAFANRLKQAGLDVVVLGEGEKRPPPRPAAAVDAKLTEEDTPPPPSRPANRDAANASDAFSASTSNVFDDDFGSESANSSAFDDDFGAPTSSAFQDDFDANASASESFDDDSFGQTAANAFSSDDSFSDEDFDATPAAQSDFDDDFSEGNVAGSAAEDDFASEDDFSSAPASEASSDGFDEDFDRDAFDDDGFGTAIRERVPAANQDDKDDQGGKKKRRSKKEKPAKKEKKPRKAKADGEKKGSNPALVVLLVLLLLLFGSAAALILLPEEYTAFVPQSVRTSVEQAPGAVSSFFVSLPGRVSALWGGQPTPPVADTPEGTPSTTPTPTDTSDTEGDGSEIIAVPSFEEDTDTADTTNQPADTTNVPEDSGDAIVEVTPERIFTAAGNGTAEEINALAQAGADFNIRDDFGQTPLIYALNNGQAVVQALINQGANVNAQTDAGWTPLMYAARDASGNIISVLLQAGADPSITNSDGQTAVQIAQNTPGREGAAQIILDSQ